MNPYPEYSATANPLRTQITHTTMGQPVLAEPHKLGRFRKITRWIPFIGYKGRRRKDSFGYY